MTRLIFCTLIAFSLFVVQSCTPSTPIEQVPIKEGIQEVELEATNVSVSYENLNDDIKQKLRNIPITDRNGNAGNATLYMAEYLTLSSSGEIGRTVFFSNVGNKQLSLDFLAGDPRSIGGDLTVFAIDPVDGATSSGLSPAVTEAAIDRAMATWDNLNCSDPLFAKNIVNEDIGVVEAIFGFGGSFSFFGDIQHAGFMPAGFFDFLFGPNNILGVTFTFIWTDDLNADGIPEVAFREIYYNDRYSWADGGNIDVETVALHEAGHGLSQAHFGTAFLSPGNGALHFSPRAVMNAGYTGVQTTITATDNAGHCSNWANWPLN